MRSILLTLFLCSSIVAQDPPASKIELSIEKDKYEIKDNVFIDVKNADEKIRVKIVSPSLEVLPPIKLHKDCLLYTSPSPRDVEESRMPSSA